MLHLNAYMATCRARDDVRQQTIANLRATDWKGKLIVEFDDASRLYPLERHRELVRRILRRAAKEEQLFLFFEDDLDFNRHLSYNLAAWQPLQLFVPGTHFFASLCNLGVSIVKSLPESACVEALPATAEGSQALVISQATARYFDTCWGVEPDPRADLKLFRLAARVGPIRYHHRSLAQHVGTKSLCGGEFREAADFVKEWKSS